MVRFLCPLATGLTELVVFKIFVSHRDGNEFELLPTKQNSLLLILGVNYVIYEKPQLSPIPDITKADISIIISLKP